MEEYWYSLLLTNIIHITLTFLSTLLLPKFSNQNLLLRGQNFLFHQFTNFDAIHYLTNQYTHQPNFAFLPFYTLICRTMVQIFNGYSIIVLVTLNKILFTLSIIDLLKICRQLSLNQKQTKNIALLYIFNPASVFFHSVYTQSLYSFLTFKFIVLVIQKKNFIIPTLILSISTLVRSTAIFLLPIIGLQILINFLKCIKNLQLKKSILYLSKGIFILILSLGPFICYLIWGYYRICIYNTQLQKCQNFFNIYSYVQDKHWNVGFLKYFKIENIIFILIGLPSVIIGLYSLRYMKIDEKRMGLNLSFLILIGVTIFYTNIQSSTRFLCSHPLFYVNVSMLRKNYVVRFWNIGYYLVGFILFTVGFPWT